MKFTSFTFILPVFNESARVSYHARTLNAVSDSIVVDAGSTDNTTELVQKLAPCAKLIAQPNPSGVRSVIWYKRILAHVRTGYVLFGNAGHIYPTELLKEIEYAITAYSPDVLRSRNVHYYAGRKDSAIGPARIIDLHTLINFFYLMTTRPSTHYSGLVVKAALVDWSVFQTHRELCIRPAKKISIYNCKCNYASFRDDDSASIEIKNARYASDHASYLSESLSFSVTQWRLVFTYIKHVFNCYLLKGAFIQGVSGLIYSHYFASYHVSVLVRLWEHQQGISSRDLVLSLNHNIRLQSRFP
jgi:glycosyltransferase involved in cell wall biosynthesis